VHPWVVIAFKGSSTEDDRTSDASIYHGREFRGVHPSVIEMIDPQFRRAENLLVEVMRSVPPSHIVMTGHSLGGSIAEALAMKYPQIEAFVFNPGMGRNKDYQQFMRRFHGEKHFTNLYRHSVRNDPATLLANTGMGTTYFYVPMDGMDPHSMDQFTQRPVE